LQQLSQRDVMTIYTPTAGYLPAQLFFTALSFAKERAPDIAAF